MKVKAIKEGFYGGARKRPGDEFEISSPQLFSKLWMKSLESLKEEEPKPEVKAKGKNSKDAGAKSSGDVEVI